MDVLRRAFEVSPPDAPTLDAWWETTKAERERWSTTIDRALIGGSARTARLARACDRLGIA